MCAVTMADMNVPANDAPVEQAPDVAPPIRTDDQILPVNKWVPIGKSNCVLDVLKSQRNPIFPMAVALLKNTNFFRAFTASSTIPAIYIQQFWDTMCFNSATGLYSCQLDEQWFNLHKDLLRDALDITPANDNNPFVAPPSSDTVIDYVNTLGYPSTLRNVSAMSVNALYQPWRAVLSMINMCLTGKTAGYDRPRHPVLQILWGIIHRSNIDYAERIWEEFVQSIQTFLTDRKNLATDARGKKKTAHLLIPNVRFTKLIIHHLRTKHNIHPRTGSPLHHSHDESILNTLRFVGKDGREIFGMPISPLSSLATGNVDVINAHADNIKSEAMGAWEALGSPSTSSCSRAKGFSYRIAILTLSFIDITDMCQRALRFCSVEQQKGPSQQNPTATDALNIQNTTVDNN
ncbi:hypothetical protein Tco_0999650 [Tanacetum coccineum]